MKKKWVFIVGIIAILLIAAGSVFGYQQWNENKTQEKKDRVAKEWVEMLKAQSFEEIPQLVASDSLEKAGYTKESIVEKYKAIFGGIGVSNMEIEYEMDEEDNLEYVATFDTVLGTISEIHYKTKLIESDEDYKVDWTAELIFPGMLSDDKIRYTVDEAVRGEIVDRNNSSLALNTITYQAGVVPKNLGEGQTRTNKLANIANRLAITVDFIEGQLGQSWVQDEHFVPLKTLPYGADTPVIEGVQYQQVDTRAYPLREAAAHITGYVGEVNAEDIEKDPTLQAGDVIGRTGLEFAFEKELRGQNGGEIYIETANGDKRATIQKIEKQDGQTIEVTIDANLQQTAFDALGDAAGSTVVMEPKTGNLLALVSKPSYNPNQFVVGISQSQYDDYNNDEDKPFISRITTRYAPGSTFKPITASIGLESGVTTVDETHQISGLQWQKDESWGNYRISRVSETARVNLRTALVKSDNIYFAQEALEMGEETFREGLNKLTFGESYELPLTMEPAQISNEESFGSEILLADTAYGQGQLLMSPIHMVTNYSVLANDGVLTYPNLIAGSEAKTKEVFAKETIDTIRPMLVEVVTAPEGTAHELNGLGNIAAKTGTAELKKAQGERGVENSLITVFDANDGGYMAVSIVEDHRKAGKTATQLIKPVIQYLELLTQ
ncbi:penicillin-binding transpeptidase domain-containing protein [Ureibacillus aquaedulcis]|uniref:Penicillin-binding transpeptidase domain-containing protein n=1 Tax=Ureibacillus aquaedulcis TaxID=3058421 RepID=A0ABT8GKX2_9BACL|nr:penicillin-binding transpeptidase domain-containing protein [Ureibacillus sp. BA0131]MDN4492019.1 penicillin-binding transpeptidase domain-containing protein [Ureibacillus sp. BA0131]